ncbi:hypothetical protein BDP27DRAFT_1363996 [Rhodocollybia butyracea]|uniref:Uncharacterized protein n=1 Tax=Rhodocollybia butyracea TaxID=206335 RepID=A0A9P5U798_9AGAR|nr:hypothetical protein BDP27DRAFT_1363996 [Rhodocollybia butyracea]
MRPEAAKSYVHITTHTVGDPQMDLIQAFRLANSLKDFLTGPYHPIRSCFNAYNGNSASSRGPARAFNLWVLLIIDGISSYVLFACKLRLPTAAIAALGILFLVGGNAAGGSTVRSVPLDPYVTILARRQKHGTDKDSSKRKCKICTLQNTYCKTTARLEGPIVNLNSSSSREAQVQSLCDRDFDVTSGVGRIDLLIPPVDS